MRKLVVSLALVTVVGLMAPSHAAINVAVAAPGGDVAGYATPTVVLIKGAPANFFNADPLAPHDIVSDERRNNQHIFRSAVSSGPGEGLKPITGVENLDIGTYGFHCSIHINMQGTLDVRA
jgi:plastocyanin